MLVFSPPELQIRENGEQDLTKVAITRLHQFRIDTLGQSRLHFPIRLY